MNLSELLRLPKSLMRVPFVRDVARMQVGVLVSFVCSFGASVLYLRLLGLEEYGRFAVIGAFAGLFAFITNLGQQQTTITFFAEAYSKKDRQGMALSMRYYLAMSLIALAVHGALFFLYPIMAEWMYGDPRIGQLARLISVASILDPLYNFVLIVLQTVRRITLMTVLQNSLLIVQFVAAVILLFMGYGIAGILWSSIIGSTIFCIVTLALYPTLRRSYDLPTAREVLQASHGKRLWRYFADGFWIAIDKNLAKQYPGIFIVLLSFTSPATTVGLVRLAFRLADLPLQFGLSSVATLASSVIPQLSRKGNAWKQNLKKLLLSSIAMHVILSLGAAIVIPPLIPYVYGPDSKLAAYPLLVIITVHLSLVIHVLVTPLLRLYSRVWVGTIVTAIATAGSIGVFFTLHQVMRDTFSLYIALIFYHTALAFVIFPTLRIIRKNRLQD